MLVSERIGQFFLDDEGAHDRLEYTEYGAGDAWVVLLHGQLMPRRMHQPLARALAAEGLHVVTLDLLGHGRSDRPADPHAYSMQAFAEQVVALLDHLGAPQAVIGGTSLGANVSLEVAVLAPERVRGLIIEMPVLNNAVEAGILAFAPLMFAARFLPFTVTGLRLLTRPVPRGLVPFWAGIVLDTLDQRPDSVAAVVHGMFFGRVAPSSRQRRAITAPALVVGHPADPIHPAADAAMLAEEMPNATFERARSILEWRATPARLNRPRPSSPSPAGKRRAAVAVRAADARSRGRMGRCLSTATRRSCCAPTSLAVGCTVPTASSPCWPWGSLMPLYRDEAIVLRTHKLGEADRIITLLTRNHGRVRAVAKGVRRTTSRWGSRLEPFTHVDLQLAEGRNLDTITQAETLTPFSGEIGLDYERYTAGTVMLETADRLVVEERQPSLQQFLLLVGGLRAMASGERGPNQVLDSFLLRSLAVSGYAPSFEHCARCGEEGPHRWFSPASGGVLCATCRVPGSASPAPETIAVLGALLAGDWPTVEAADPRHLKEASGVVAAYLAWHLERGLRSFAYLER